MKPTNHKLIAERLEALANYLDSLLPSQSSTVKSAPLAETIIDKIDELMAKDPALAQVVFLRRLKQGWLESAGTALAGGGRAQTVIRHIRQDAKVFAFGHQTGETIATDITAIARR